MRWFAGSIILAYVATLATSAAHLAEWYANTNGDLPPYLPLFLAITLEANAFILSLLSNYILRESAWARYGALAALALVWLGNFESMRANAPALPLWSVFASSLFVPVGTYVMGKVLGELLSTQERKAEPNVSTLVPLRERVLSFLAEGARTTRDIYEAFADERGRLRDTLHELSQQGAIQREGTLWKIAPSSLDRASGE